MVLGELALGWASQPIRRLNAPREGGGADVRASGVDDTALDMGARVGVNQRLPTQVDHREVAAEKKSRYCPAVQRYAIHYYCSGHQGR